MYNKEKNIDIAELILEVFPEDTKDQRIIRSYIQSHICNCNNYLYSNYIERTTMLNTIFDILLADLGKAVCTNLIDKNII